MELKKEKKSGKTRFLEYYLLLFFTLGLNFNFCWSTCINSTYCADEFYIIQRSSVDIENWENQLSQELANIQAANDPVMVLYRTNDQTPVTFLNGFEFYGIDISQCRIHLNGLILFGNPLSVPLLNPLQIPSKTPPYDFIYGKKLFLAKRMKHSHKYIFFFSV